MNFRLPVLIALLLLVFRVHGQDFYKQLAQKAELLTFDDVTYDPSYFSIDYPMGDVPSEKGVCTAM